MMMARRHKGAGELAEEIGITPANLSILKNNKARAVRLSTLNAICKALNCQPGDILEYVDDPEEDASCTPPRMPTRNVTVKVLNNYESISKEELPWNLLKQMKLQHL